MKSAKSLTSLSNRLAHCATCGLSPGYGHACPQSNVVDSLKLVDFFQVCKHVILDNVPFSSCTVATRLPGLFSYLLLSRINDLLVKPNWVFI